MVNLDHTFDARITEGWKVIKTYTRTGATENPTQFYMRPSHWPGDLNWIEKAGSNYKFFWESPGDPPIDKWGYNASMGLMYNPMSADDDYQVPGATPGTWNIQYAAGLARSARAARKVFRDSNGDIHKFSFYGDQRTINHQMIDSLDVGDNATPLEWTGWTISHQTFATTAQYIMAFDAVQDGDTIHIATLEKNLDGSGDDQFRYYYYKGDLTTQTFSVTAETIYTVSRPNGDIEGQPTNDDAPHIAVRSDDYVAVLHVGTPAIRTGSTYDRDLAISVRNTSGTWTKYDNWRTAGNIAVRGTMVAGLAYGASDRLHVYWVQYDYGISQQQFKHQSMTTAGSKDTVTNVATPPVVLNLYDSFIHAYDASGWKCQIYYCNEIGINSYVRVYVVEHTSQANPTMSSPTTINTDDYTGTDPDYTGHIPWRASFGNDRDRPNWTVCRIGGVNYFIARYYEQYDPAGGSAMYKWNWWAIQRQDTYQGAWTAPLPFRYNQKDLSTDDAPGTEDQYKWPLGYPVEAPNDVGSDESWDFGANAWSISGTNYVALSTTYWPYRHDLLFHFEPPVTPSVEKDHTFDAILMAVVPVDHTFDAILASTSEVALDHTFDAIAFAEVAVDHTFDALTFWLRTLDHTFDAILVKAHTIAADMDLAIDATAATAKDKTQMQGLGVVGHGAGGTVGPDQGLAPFGIKVYRPTRKIIRGDQE